MTEIANTSAEQQEEHSTSGIPPTGRLTASRLALAEICPGAFALPHVETDTEASNRGTEIHDYIDRLLSTGDADTSYIRDDEVRELCEKLDPSTLYWVAKASHDTDKDLAGPQAQGPLATDLPVIDELFTELPLALDPKTSEARPLERKAGKSQHRNYSAAPEGWVCGTADTVTVSKGMQRLSESSPAPDEVIITDWKTGMMAVPHPERNLQLRFLALAACRSYGIERAVVQIAYIGTDGEVNVSSFEFDAGDLAEIEEQIRRINRRVNDARKKQLQLKVGAHCRYCPALRFCPAQASAARALLENVPDSENEERVETRAARLTPQDAALIWERLQAVKHAVKVSEEVLQAYVLQEEHVDLPGEKQLALVTSKRDKILPEVAMPLLRDFYGDDADLAVSITKKGLSTIAGKRSSKIIQEITKRNGIQTSYSERLQEIGKKT